MNMPKKLLTNKEKLMYVWEHYILHEIEVASSLIVMVVDTFGFVHIPAEHTLIVHQLSSTGCLALMTASLIRRYRKYRATHHFRGPYALLHYTKEADNPDLAGDSVDYGVGTHTQEAANV